MTLPGDSAPRGEIVSAPEGVDVAGLTRAVDEALRAAGAPPPSGARRGERDLAALRHLLANPGVEYRIGFQTPILGQAWARVREQIHGEARLYVDALMARQAEVDRRLVDLIEWLTEQLVRAESRLTADVEQLQARTSGEVERGAQPPADERDRPTMRRVGWTEGGEPRLAEDIARGETRPAEDTARGEARPAEDIAWDEAGPAEDIARLEARMTDWLARVDARLTALERGQRAP